MPKRRTSGSIWFESTETGGRRSLDDLDFCFISQKSLEYCNRLLLRSQVIKEDLFEVILWAWGSDVDYLIRRLSKIIGPVVDEPDEQEDPSGFSTALALKFKLLPKTSLRSGIRELVRLNEARKVKLTHGRPCGIERTLRSLEEAFSLTDAECELACLTFLTCNLDLLHDLFFTSLECQKLGRRHYLTTALGITSAELQRVLGGTLSTIGFLDVDKFEIEIKRDFMAILLKDPTPADFTESFFAPVPITDVPLSAHFFETNEIERLKRLLSLLPVTSTHVLLYGAPGTGKTSFANRLVNELGVRGYHIVKGEANDSAEKRTAIGVCLKMTNHDEGSILIVDEADNVLNTRFSWFSRGETQDKGWLNDLLEKPGVRMIWITNNIEDIEPSVLRRFAHSIQFRKFGARQRVKIWESVLKKNKARRFLREEDVESLAREFNVSAGAIDIAVRKEVEGGKPEKGVFLGTLRLTLRRHETLLNGGIEKVHKDRIEESYSIEGLNIIGDISSILSDLTEFNAYLRGKEREHRINMNLLFYGPPGTGKSELARYVSKKLDRELICKKASDILNPYVGMTEKLISEAFKEAEREDAVLVIDEVDTMLFNRNRAQRSWEISHTNEFLTQMERFRGILVCTTNRFEDLDSASVRRFNHKLEFRYLRPEGNLSFYRRMLAHLALEPLDDRAQNALEGMTNLAPGDFKVVRDRFAFKDPTAITHDMLIRALQKELRAKNINAGKNQVGF